MEIKKASNNSKLNNNSPVMYRKIENKISEQKNSETNVLKNVKETENIDLDEPQENTYTVNSEYIADIFEKILKSKISTNAEDASKGNFLDPSRILDEYWTKEELRFEKQDNGTYLIFKGDVAMGYTDEETVKSMSKEQEKAEFTKKQIESYSAGGSGEHFTMNTSSNTGGDNSSDKKYEDMTYEERLNSGLDPTMNSKNSRLDYSRTTSDHWTKGEKVAAVTGIGLVAGILGPELAGAGGVASTGGSSGTTALSAPKSTTVSTIKEASSAAKGASSAAKGASSAPGLPGPTANSIPRLSNSDQTAINTMQQAAKKLENGVKMSRKEIIKIFHPDQYVDCGPEVQKMADNLFKKFM